MLCEIKCHPKCQILKCRALAIIESVPHILLLLMARCIFGARTSVTILLAMALGILSRDHVTVPLAYPTKRQYWDLILLTKTKKHNECISVFGCS